MNVIVKVPTSTDLEKVKTFVSMFRFPSISIDTKDVKETPISSEVPEGEFCIDVIDGEEDIKARDLEVMLDNGHCSLLVFNQEIQEAEEPKVIFATDLSEQAAFNLEKFKELKPAGFAGATVISEPGIAVSEVTTHEMSNRLLERTKSAVQATQANLIIANFDLRNLGRKSTQLSNIMKLVLQNRCHVLILKSY